MTEENKDRFVPVWVLNAIEDGEEVASTYALEKAHLPHGGFAIQDLSDSTKEECHLRMFRASSDEVMMARNNSRRWLEEQIEQYGFLLNQEWLQNRTEYCWGE